MSTVHRNPPLITPKVQSLILSSKVLRDALAPEDFEMSPYDVLDYQGVLTIHDTAGMRATVERRQYVRFLQNGVSAILDHMWGTGILAYYENSAGKIGPSFLDAGRRHLMVNLRRQMAKGDRLRFVVRRVVMASFLDSHGWLETAIDHPVRNFGQTVIFPKGRPCQEAVLQLEDELFELPIHELPDGRTTIRFQAPYPDPEPICLVRWLW
jgi:hypothetical protein